MWQDAQNVTGEASLAAVKSSIHDAVRTHVHVNAMSQAVAPTHCAAACVQTALLHYLVLISTVCCAEGLGW